MSMRTMAFSVSNRYSASAFASSVLPTPVGPRNRKLPMGLFGIGQARAVAADGAGHRRDTASSWPTTRSCSSLFQIDELLHFALHHLRERGCPSTAETTSAISSSVDLLLQDGAVLLLGVQRCLGLRPACCCSSGMRRVAQLGGHAPGRLRGWRALPRAARLQARP